MAVRRKSYAMLPGRRRRSGRAPCEVKRLGTITWLDQSPSAPLFVSMSSEGRVGRFPLPTLTPNGPGLRRFVQVGDQVEEPISSEALRREQPTASRDRLPQCRIGCLDA